jgi:D-aspartate ligase
VEKVEKIKIQPVLVGGDINCYSVARAYHEAYGVKSIAFGKMLLGATKDSNIIDFRIDPNMGNKDEFIKVLLNKSIISLTLPSVSTYLTITDFFP